MMNISLFPKNEEWGTGDEALDLKLNLALKKAADSLTLPAIFDFYSYAKSIRPRAHNPAFGVTIDFVIKALLHFSSPDVCIDELLVKLKGEWFRKERVEFQFDELASLKEELISKRCVRFKDQIDFFLQHETNAERNPFVQHKIKRSEWVLSAKIIFKEFRFFLNGEVENKNFHHPLFLSLKDQHRVLVLNGFAEIWYHDNQLFCLSLLKQ